MSEKKQDRANNLFTDTGLCFCYLIWKLNKNDVRSVATTLSRWLVHHHLYPWGMYNLVNTEMFMRTKMCDQGVCWCISKVHWNLKRNNPTRVCWDVVKKQTVTAGYRRFYKNYRRYRNIPWMGTPNNSQGSEMKIFEHSRRSLLLTAA